MSDPRGYDFEEGGGPDSTPSSPRRRVRLETPLPLTSTGNPDSSRRSSTDNHYGTPTTSAEPLATPTLSESAGKLRKNLSFKSLKDLELKELSTVVYRKGSRQEMKVYRPKNDEEVFAHALRGGLRAFPSSLFATRTRRY